MPFWYFAIYRLQLDIFYKFNLDYILMPLNVHMISEHAENSHAIKIYALSECSAAIPRFTSIFMLGLFSVTEDTFRSMFV